MTIGTENKEELKKLLPPWDTEALMALCSKANFTVRDMANWCGVSTSSMRCWAMTKTAPHRVYRGELLKRMALLERALRECPEMLPVPLMPRADRRNYIQKVLDHALSLPAESASERRV